MTFSSFDDLARELRRDRDVRVAANENSLRRTLGAAFDEARRAKSLSVRALAKSLGSLSQTQRLLHRELGGTLTLRTLCKGADALDLDLQVRVRVSDDVARVSAASLTPAHFFDFSYEVLFY